MRFGALSETEATAWHSRAKKRFSDVPPSAQDSNPLKRFLAACSACSSTCLAFRVWSCNDQTVCAQSTEGN